MVKYINVMVDEHILKLLHKLKHKKEFRSINDTIKWLIAKRDFK